MTGYTIRAGTGTDLAQLGDIEHDAAQLYRQAGYDFCGDWSVRDEAETLRALHTGAVFVACTPGNKPCDYAQKPRIAMRKPLMDA